MTLAPAQDVATLTSAKPAVSRTRPSEKSKSVDSVATTEPSTLLTAEGKKVMLFHLGFFKHFRFFCTCEASPKCAE